MLSRALIFSLEQNESFFQDLPAAPAVFILRGEGDPYISKTANLRRRLQRLLGPPVEHSRRLNLRDRVREIEFTVTRSDFESQFLLYQVLREAFPKTYATRLRLRPAPLVKLHLENEYPRASVTTRLGKVTWGQPSPAVQTANRTGDEALAFAHHPGNLYYGPFPSRTVAEKFASDALDFFRMRRCVEDLRPDPSFPGCVYSEMKMCLAPCFKGCTDEEYRREVSRVQNFFDSGGDSLVRDFAQQRDRASTELAFEEAATIHTKIEKLKPLLSQLPEIVHRIDRLKALIIQPGAQARPSSGERAGNEASEGPAHAAETTTTTEPQREQCVCFFVFQNCSLSGPIEFSIKPRAESLSMESRVAEVMATFSTPTHHSAAERMEHLSILKRWFYRSNRVGEVFFADDKGEWPIRRIVRGIGRVYRGETQQEPVPFSATQDPSPTS